MEVRFSEIRGKKAYNGNGDFLGKIVNVFVNPNTNEAFLLAERIIQKNQQLSLFLFDSFKKIVGNEVIFSINDIPSFYHQKGYDIFLTDEKNPGAMNMQIFSLNRKKVLGLICDYLLDSETGERKGILIEEVSSLKRRFLALSEKIKREEESAIGIKKILIDPKELIQVK